MPDSSVTARTLSLPEELILMLLNEQTGYFHQVPGWDLNCAVVGAALAELSLLSRIDTDLESLLVVDRTETGDPVLDPILQEIADEPEQRNTRYWIERFAANAESIIDQTLERLVEAQILEHHDGEFWTLAETRWHEELFGVSQKGTVGQFIKTRVVKALFTDAIPHPREVIVICLVNTCDVFRFMFDVDDETKERIDFICQMDLIGRSIAAAVEHNIASPMLRRSTLTKKRPSVALRRLLLSPHIRSGNIPALFGDLTKEYGPVFEIRAPFIKPMIFLGGPETNHWVNRYGRMPESRRLFLRFRENLRCAWRIAFAGWRRSFPAAQGHGTGVFAGPAVGSAGPGVCASSASTWRTGRTARYSLCACAGE